MSHNDKGCVSNDAVDTTAKKDNGASIRMLLHEMRNAAQCCNAEVDAFALMGAFFEYLPIPAWIKTRNLDGTWTMLRVNHAFSAVTGITVAAYVGADPQRYWLNVATEEALQASEAWDDKVLATGGAVAGEVDIPDRRDPSKLMRWDGYKWPILKDGRNVAICGIAQVYEVQ